MDVTTETVIPFSRGDRLPRPRTARTLLRWRKTGLLAADRKTRVKLEAERIGNEWVTTLEAYGRFVKALNQES